MRNSIGSPELSYNADATVLDAYFAEAAKGPEHREQVFMGIWNNLDPKERLQLQLEACNMAGGDPLLAEQCSQSVLLLVHVNQLALDAAGLPGGVENTPIEFGAL